MPVAMICSPLISSHHPAVCVCVIGLPRFPRAVRPLRSDMRPQRPCCVGSLPRLLLLRLRREVSLLLSFFFGITANSGC